LWRAVFVCALLLACAPASWAQSAAESKKKPTEAAQDGATPKKKPADAAAAPTESGPDATTVTFGDWSIVCARSSADSRPCQVVTTIVLRNQTAPFARVVVTRVSKDEPSRLLALVPVNVSTQSPLRISVDSGKTDLSLPIRNCTPGGCLADAELGKDLIQALQTPAKSPAQMTIVDASGKTASVSFSLRGLSDALDAYFKQTDKQ
jgi:invasion protein IalB